MELNSEHFFWANESYLRNTVEVICDKDFLNYGDITGMS